MLETAGPMQAKLNSISDEILRQNYQFQLKSSNLFAPYPRGSKYHCESTIEEMSPRAKEQKFSTRSPPHHHHLSPDHNDAINGYHKHNANNSNNRVSNGHFPIRPTPIPSLQGSKRMKEKDGMSRNLLSPPNNRSGDENVEKSPVKSSKRFTGFGISDIIGEESAGDESDDGQIRNKRKLPLESEIESKRRRSVSVESNEQNSPETHMTPPSNMMLPNYMTPYPNPYFVNALASQAPNPTMLPMAPHLLPEADAMLRPAMHPAFAGANPAALCANTLPMNPYLMPQFLKRPVPGYDASYLMEQQQRMILMLNQAKLNPWYQMNPFLRAMATGSADPVLLASLMSSQGRLEAPQQPENEEMRPSVSGPYLDHLQNIEAQKNFIKKMYDQTGYAKHAHDVMNANGRSKSHEEKSPEMNRKILATEKIKKCENISETRDEKRRVRECLQPRKVCPSDVGVKQTPQKTLSPKSVPNRKIIRENSTTSKSVKPQTKLLPNNKSIQKHQPKLTGMKSSIDGVDNKLKSGGESTSTKPTSYKNLTRERRLVANARERTRVHTISSAFEELRSQIPSYSCNQKLSKLAILRIACSYIKSLSVLSGYDESEFEESVESCTKVLQSESRARSRRKSNRSNSEYELDNNEKNIFAKSSTSDLNKYEHCVKENSKIEEEVNVED